ncbi:MAG: hypothetical protein M1828_002556 [Chrysothrix sp. TS-e1954]|nr:MAG: hypothetical protein M1828_002556 [Chrysothrix sp. TS-e1954]
MSDCFALHVKAQNAGVVVQRRRNETIFHLFDISPSSEAVTSTQGRLRQCFPDAAIAIPNDRFDEGGHFVVAVSSLLTSLCQDTPDEVKPKSSKVGRKFFETRDVINSRLITEMFKDMLHGIGQYSGTQSFYKHTRDEVHWKDALYPWRRSSLWLFIRVAIRISLRSTNDDGLDEVWYKRMMLYTMSRVAGFALQAKFDSDSLFTMTAKLHRRTLKLGAEDDLCTPAWLCAIKDEVRKINDEVTHRWKLIERRSTTKASVQGSLSLSTRFHDTKLRVDELQDYLNQTRHDLEATADACKVADIHTLRFQNSPKVLPDSALLPEIESDHIKRLLLYDLERWVRDCLEEWLDTRFTEPEMYLDLAKFIENYSRTALCVYSNSPEDMSTLFLTTTELWIAFDRVILFQLPLFRDFHPELREGLLDPLLLKTSAEMYRLHRAENYISERHARANQASPSVLKSFAEVKGIAVRYYHQSPEHQALMRDIDKATEVEKTTKIREYEQKTAQYDHLMLEINSTACDSESAVDDEGYIYQSHPSWCHKCYLQHQARQIVIERFEEPLPRSQRERQAVVFELTAPSLIRVWRDTTFSLLNDVYATSVKGNDQGEMRSLLSYKALERFANDRKGRLTLASSVKPFAVTHYRKPLHIKSVALSDLVVPNCMRYQMHDSHDRNWITSVLDGNDVDKKCAFPLPQGSLVELQFAVSDTAHTSNEILAMQDRAPPELNLHEYYSFGTLRAGHRLQWFNILRELTSGSLDFSRLEVNFLVTQAAWQVGPERGKSQTILSKARHIALKWVDQIKATDSLEATEDVSKKTRVRLLEIILVCHLTYAVDQEFLREVVSSEEDIAIIIQCLITINECQDSLGLSYPLSLKLLLNRSMRLNHALEPILRDKILENSAGVDRTIEKVWSGYCRGTAPWTAGNEGYERYIYVSCDGSQNNMKVQFDLLTGRLLVNGRPLSRLPDAYEQHPVYVRILGTTVLSVFPSSLDKMAFQSRQKHFGFDLHFALTGKNAFILRAVDESGTYELVSSDVFGDMFPTAFVRDYAHWLDLEKSFIQWRPLKSAWERSSTEWWLDIRSFDNVSLSNDTLKLVNPTSATARFIFQYSDAIEAREYVHITMDESSGALGIQLPRLVLDFRIESNSEQLMSRQFCGMFLDKDYRLETLTGLQSRILLRRNDEHSRLVIIPRGSVKVTDGEGHVSVKIYTGNTMHVRYYAYELDDILQRLVDDCSLSSKLYRCYLHAVTSYCLPDSFTGKTGTEEALDIITSPSMKSFQNFGSDEIALLQLIESCSPCRRYYPGHLRVMQEVNWTQLPPLSQHPSFARHVKSIGDYARSLDFLREKSMALPEFMANSPIELLEKAEIRDAQLRSSGYGAESHTTRLDVSYTRREDPSGVQNFSKVYHVARLADSWSARLAVSRNLLTKIESWSRDIGPARDAETHSLGYDRDWLSFDNSTLAQNWCRLTQLMSNTHRTRDRYNVLITLSTMAYSEKADCELIETLLAFATVADVRRIPLDCSEPLKLSHGYSIAKPTLKAIAMKHLWPFDASPDAKLTKHTGESKHDLNMRRKASFKEHTARTVEAFVESVVSQWNSSKRLSCSGMHHGKYINTTKACTACEDQFRSWERNATFRNQVLSLQRILDDLIPCDNHYPEQNPCHPVYACPRRRRFVTWKEALLIPVPQLFLNDYGKKLGSQVVESFPNRDQHIELQSLVAELGHADAQSSYERSYVQSLETSLQHLRSRPERRLGSSLQRLRENINCIVSTQADEVQRSHASLRSLSTAPFDGVLSIVPSLRLCNSSLLRLLASNSGVDVPQTWKSCLIKYGLALSELQHARRIAKCLRDNSDILLELSDFDHAHWSPKRYPDWLLFELENNLMIRKVQVDIANEMISPSAAGNSVMQLHMGEGKSSVIVPIAATALATGKTLTRIIVLKPLAKQMQDLLVRKLGGLLGRRVFNMPVSRSNQFTECGARKVREMCNDCLRLGGVLLLQPEHILSFHLMAIERSLELSPTGKILHSTNRWLSKISRDILDESDEVLNVRMELVYAVGSQQSIDLGSERWVLVQELLSLIERCARLAVRQRPNDFQLDHGSPGSFPRIRILTDAASDLLIGLVVNEILYEGFHNLPKHVLDRIGSGHVRHFLQDPQTRRENHILIKRLCNNEKMWKRLLFLRGLLAKGVVRFALQKKRWRVNYGTDPSRTKLAVPYKAKDVPSPRSEFSHPDVAIILTCLSYYYNHLTDEEMYLSLQNVFKLDVAHDEYCTWTECLPSIPKAYTTLAGVNMRDPSLPQTVFPFLRQSKAAIDFYLSTSVFPREMKEFPYKLSSSGWDLVESKTHPVSGFSGTNDSRVLLPCSITQNDLPQLTGTNAEMLQRLLQPENKFLPVSTSSTQSLSTMELLESVTSASWSPPIRVILDVGAQILEMTNLELSQAWLGKTTSCTTRAVVFFNTNNELCVLDRDDVVEPFATSPFAKRMDECLVYLDESHTRGTDLKLPPNYRAAVTLGPYLTKDKLAQGQGRNVQRAEYSLTIE